MDQPLIPGLPDDLAVVCLAKLSHGYHGILETVSKGWRDTIRSSNYSKLKAREGWSGDWLFALTEMSNNQWIAYDPDANKWHPLPVMRGDYSNYCHLGFSSVSVHHKFFVIGGSYTSDDPALSNQRYLITNDVLQFDPFAKQWIKTASMRTPRFHFVCCVLFGKIYVAGGHSSYSGFMGLLLPKFMIQRQTIYQELKQLRASYEALQNHSILTSGWLEMEIEERERLVGGSRL